MYLYLLVDSQCWIWLLLGGFIEALGPIVATSAGKISVKNKASFNKHMHNPSSLVENLTAIKAAYAALQKAVDSVVKSTSVQNSG